MLPLLNEQKNFHDKKLPENWLPEPFPEQSLFCDQHMWSRAWNGYLPGDYALRSA